MKKAIAFTIIYLCCLLQLYPSHGIKTDTLSVNPNYVFDGDMVECAIKDAKIEDYIAIAGAYDTDMSKDNKYRCAIACACIGDEYFKKESYPQAFDFYFKGLQICEENEFKRLVPRFYKNIGNIHSVFGDNEFALDYYEKGLDVSRQQGLTDMKIKILINTVGICLYENRIEEAKSYIKEMKSFVDKNKYVSYFIHMSDAMISVYNGEFDKAVIQFNNAKEEIAKKGLGAEYLASVQAELINLYEKKGDQDSMIYYCMKNYDLSQKHNLPSMQLKILKVLYTIYMKNGNKDKADRYMEEYIALSDSLEMSKTHKKIKNIQVAYELNKNYDSILKLTYEKNAKDLQIRQQRIILLVIAVCMLIFISMMIILYMQKHKLSSAYKNLVRRNNDIISSERVNKEVKTNLENKLKTLEEKNAYLETLIKTNTETEPPAEATAEEDSEKSKSYSSSKISEELKKDILQKILSVMEDPEKFCDAEFSLERLSTQIGSNSRYVSQIINETYNKNFRTFLNEYRVKEASIRLADKEKYGNYTMKAIGESLGYKSQANFIESFRKITGVTPSMYLKLLDEKGIS